MMKRFSRAWWENHFRYQGWKYVMLAVWSVVGVSILFTITAYRVPPERRVDVYFVGPYADQDMLDALALEIQADLPHIEQVTCFSIPLVGEADDIYNNQQRLFIYMGAGEGDVYIFPGPSFSQYADNETFYPLDMLIEDGWLTPGDDVSTIKQKFNWAGIESNYTVGVSLAAQTGLKERELFNSANSYMGIMAYSTNPEQSAEVMQWLLENR